MAAGRVETEAFEVKGGADVGGAADVDTTDAALLGMADLVLLALDRASSAVSWLCTLLLLFTLSWLMVLAWLLVRVRG